MDLDDEHVVRDERMACKTEKRGTSISDVDVGPAGGDSGCLVEFIFLVIISLAFLIPSSELYHICTW